MLAHTCTGAPRAVAVAEMHLPTPEVRPAWLSLRGPSIGWARPRTRTSLALRAGDGSAVMSEPQRPHPPTQTTPATPFLSRERVLSLPPAHVRHVPLHPRILVGCRGPRSIGGCGRTPRVVG